MHSAWWSAIMFIRYMGFRGVAYVGTGGVVRILCYLVSYTCSALSTVMCVCVCAGHLRVICVDFVYVLFCQRVEVSLFSLSFSYKWYMLLFHICVLCSRKTHVMCGYIIYTYRHIHYAKRTCIASMLYTHNASILHTKYENTTHTQCKHATQAPIRNMCIPQMRERTARYVFHSLFQFIASF
jgi:hypothetical protein